MHCRMIVEPEQRVADFIKAGSDIVSVHAEQSATIHLHRLVNNVCALLRLFPPSLCCIDWHQLRGKHSGASGFVCWRNCLLLS